jgi:uncharacterized protein (DUF362 family)/ferredoxin
LHNKFNLQIIRGSSTKSIAENLCAALEKLNQLFPPSKEASILLKPNLNSNMNALTGNTTDLRLIAAVVMYLKDKGYKNITIGEGTNSGFYRSNISVISRLALDKLAMYYGVKLADLNYSQPVDIAFEDKISAGVAKECLEADFFINMPKLKTHFEVGMSVCLKNLMGCLVGQENKKKTHKNLAKNILCINKQIKPNLHIVDGLLAMEGLGPTRGTPVNLGLIIIGTDPYIIDLAASRIARFDYRKISTLKSAAEQGLLTDEHHQFLAAFDLTPYARGFKEPKANPLVSFIHSPKRQRYFLAVRNTAFFNYLCSTKIFGQLLFRSGLRQDNFIKREMVFEGLRLNKERCRPGCVKCIAYCPIGLKLPEALDNESSGCIGCLYCFLVCPAKAILFKGELGFMAEQLRQYDELTREVA